MIPDRQETKERFEQNVRFGRELAAHLAEGAERIATTLDRLAAVHEDLATAEHHPLKRDALSRARAERRMAQNERRASDWFRSIASGRHAGSTPQGATGQPQPMARHDSARPPKPDRSDQRLPSQ